MSSGNGVNPQRRRSTHPYRDAALVYAGLGALVVIVAYATGSSFLRSFVGGFSAFVLATAYSWWRLRSRRDDDGPEA